LIIDEDHRNKAEEGGRRGKWKALQIGEWMVVVFS